MVLAEKTAMAPCRASADSDATNPAIHCTLIRPTPSFIAATIDPPHSRVEP
jgi:hypothetical protein